jgi:hypothetical protein
LTSLIFSEVSQFTRNRIPGTSEGGYASDLNLAVGLTASGELQLANTTVCRAAEALASGHPRWCRLPQAPAGLPRRVRLPPQPPQDQRRRPDRGARHRAARDTSAADHALTDRRYSALPLVLATCTNGIGMDAGRTSFFIRRPELCGVAVDGRLRLARSCWLATSRRSIGPKRLRATRRQAPAETSPCLGHSAASFVVPLAVANALRGRRCRGASPDRTPIRSSPGHS